ncbi:carboxylesterase 5A-like [Mercenaria mercenaria]|uniref:carboxylesterase 5A-like n=1 Tax=Mercenaria mercenaria TaxID=6596 RepID=UPI00234EE25C|nr:carboxylesterase 5A-like [Mercenaria mercenaria]
MHLQILLNIVLCVSLGFAEFPITIMTNAGDLITGELEYVMIDGKNKLMSRYLGIPYAEPIVGTNRFMKPKPKQPLGRFDSRRTPMACFQQTGHEMEILKNKYGIPRFTEDCLTLNIYSPYQLSTSYLLPVMVWIHGGGFRQGAASMYSPEGLALYGNVVVVTINYRVGMFGFLRDSNGTVPGNQGLWDQHLALKWIQNNIDRFHGDKNDVTLFGQSAGGSSALLQALYPGNKGYFRRVIAESGTPLAPWAIKDIASAEKYLNDIDCPPNTNETLPCLQSKSPMMLLYNKANLGPVIDGEFLIASPEEILLEHSPRTAPARNMFASVDILLGFNDMDGVLYYNTWASLLGHNSLDFNVTKKEFDEKIVPEFVRTKFSSAYSNATRYALTELLTFFYTSWNNPKNLLTIRNTLIAMSNDPMFHVPAFQVAQAHASLQQGNTYLYEFSVHSDKHALAVPPWLKGSYHADEIPYVFGFPIRSNASIFGHMLSNFSKEEKQISRTTMTFWSNFAKTGNPNVPGKASLFWPAFNLTSQHYFQISNQMTEASVKDMAQFHPRRMAFWSHLIPHMINLLQSTIHETKEISQTQNDTFHLDLTVVPIK